jgi:hypothetical protein
MNVIIERADDGWFEYEERYPAIIIKYIIIVRYFVEYYILYWIW